MSVVRPSLRFKKGARDSGKSLSAVSRKGARDVSCSFPYCSPRCHMKNAPVRCLPYPSERRSRFKTDGQRHERWQARAGRDSLFWMELIIAHEEFTAV